MSSVLRGECKEPGGKLVAVAVGMGRNAKGQACLESCRIDGDFFIDYDLDGRAPHELLTDLESAMTILRLPLDPDRATAALDAVMERHDAERMLGISSRSLVRALVRALPPGQVRTENEAGAGLSDTDDSYRHGADLEVLDQDEALRRWAGLDLTVIRDRLRDPVMQMAMDQALAESVAAGTQPPTLRLWRWASPAVVLGRFQSLANEVHLDRARELGFTVVRRCTGGGTMLVEADRVITYSLYMPAGFVRGLDPIRSYRLCDLWLIRALRSQGIEAGWEGINDIASPRGKIGGASQRRFPGKGGGPGGILHHVTLSHSIDTRLMGQVLNTSQEKISDKAVQSARSRVDPISRQTRLDRKTLVEEILQTLPSLVGGVHMGEPGPDMEDRASRLAEERYARPGWTGTIE
ncbi:biotin/lipoate A/B protein ligase family protein [uncultured Bifidobacterium sp.]|uniref:lipoate--protein ligase family protein n=1 Tax=uncultured Bifidobacterium sp. TaxID=165187 RepID=UPI0026170711|nr:biotin/lipoate A/B protein ligase family protein [uncultured Bifidobacterium sp.]